MKHKEEAVLEDHWWFHGRFVCCPELEPLKISFLCLFPTLCLEVIRVGSTIGLFQALLKFDLARIPCWRKENGFLIK